MNLDDDEVVEEKQEELEFNKHNREDYEQLMKDSSVNLDELLLVDSFSRWYLMTESTVFPF